MRIQIPPIKCQGIKSKLVPFLLSHIEWSEQGRWIEPFIGSGVVGFNVRPKRAIFGDTNPHIINFYQAINEGRITPAVVKKFLDEEGYKLAQRGEAYYYEVRTRFNTYQDPLDFLFLTRAGFNGVIRFNSKGEFNVPFNHKPERFSKAYITKVVNQVRAVYKLCQLNDWQFVSRDFSQTLAMAEADDFVYCDPPYIGRHVDYFNSWNDENEAKLFDLLTNCPARFILSTWHSNQHRQNPYIEQYQARFQVVVKEHFYHVGAREANRKPMLEALVLNYVPTPEPEAVTDYEQLQLLEGRARYSVG